MGIIEIIGLAAALSMDAFAVAMCKGLALKRPTVKAMLICGLWFGTFQGLMPFIGFLLGQSFEQYINKVAPWVAFALLCLIGGNMVKEALGKDEDTADDDLGVKTMFLMAVATSIDALAAGITFSCEPITVFNVGVMANTVFGVCLIGVFTFAFCFVGVKVGSLFGTRYKTKAELAGGAILIILGVKILLEYLLA